MKTMWRHNAERHMKLGEYFVEPRQADVRIAARAIMQAQVSVLLRPPYSRPATALLEMVREAKRDAS
jgi:hypothetical protein